MYFYIARNVAQKSLWHQSMSLITQNLIRNVEVLRYALSNEILISVITNLIKDTLCVSSIRIVAIDT